MIPWRLFVRVAGHIRAMLLARAARDASSLQGALDRLALCRDLLDRTCRLLRVAESRGWETTTHQLSVDLLGQLKAVEDAASAGRDQLEPPAPQVASLRSLVEDLLQLLDEFGDVDIDLGGKTIAVVTEPITLEGVYLGPFAVRLHWSRLAREIGSRCFEVEALEPHPATSNEAVTHPHVSGGVLCAGDASVPLQRALAEGRIADAFFLVRGVLTTYNEASPYVALDHWHGEECHECGVCAESIIYCEPCGHDYCPDCSGFCSACEESRCGGCLERCAICEDPCCHGCLRRAGTSGRRCCADCLEPCARCGAETARDQLARPSGLCRSCLAEDDSASLSELPAAVPSKQAPREESHARRTFNPPDIQRSSGAGLCPAGVAEASVLLPPR